MNVLIKIIDSLKKWCEILDKKQKMSFFSVLFVIFISSILETLGVSIILPFVSAILNQDTILNNKFFIIFSKYFSFNTDNLIFILGGLVIVIYIFKNLFLIFSDYYTLKYENRLQKEFSLQIYSSYLMRTYEDLININSGEVLRGIGNDVAAIYYILQGALKIITGILTVILICVLLFFTDAVLSIIIFFIVFIIVFLNFVFFRKQISRCGKIYNESMATSNKVAIQGINGIKEIIVLDRRKQFINFYKNAVNVQIKEQIKYRFLQGLPNRISEILFIAGIVFGISLNVYFGVSPEVFVPSISLFAVAAIRMLPIVISISNNTANILYYYPGFDNAYKSITKSRIFLSNLKDDVYDKNIEFNDKIKLSNISWSYSSTNKNIFNDLSLTINKGEMIGIIGSSGSGKTTLADIILGLLPSKTGNITIDGVDISNNFSYISKLVGYVPQNVFLLDDTIKNNVLFGIDEKFVDENKIFDVLKKASLKDYVLSLPDGINTVVGERGTKLSGGQRQRIAIARVLYKNPEIIVFDEATSSLDNETENEVMNAINDLSKIKTIIIIAHRLSTLKKCDRILEVSNGKILEVNKNESNIFI